MAEEIKRLWEDFATAEFPAASSCADSYDHG